MKAKITKRTVDATKPGKRDSFTWDTEVTGFGLKVTPAGNKVYILQYRFGGQLFRYTIGKHGSPWTPDEARDEAIRLLGMGADGINPATIKAADKAEKTVAELCDQYLDEGCETKKPSTLATDRGRIERHIKPLLGRRRVKDLMPNDVRRFMTDVAKGKTTVNVKTGHRGRARVTGGKGTATRTVGLLGGIFAFAVAEGLRSDNPVRGVKRYPDKKGERFLNGDELGRLGGALREAEADGENPLPIIAVRLLILTGCRKSEVLSLKWCEVDFEFGCLRLEDSKTGQKVVMLGAPALQLLAEQSRQEGSPYVFPAMKGDGHYIGLPKAWARIRKRADLEEVRLHDLRHSFASTGAGAGMPLQMVGKLLGHSDPKTTARYSHIANDPAKAAADRIAETISAAMESGTEAEVLEFKKRGTE